MAHFAELDKNNVVTRVLVVNNNAINPDNEEISGIAFLSALYGVEINWKQTSYNSTFRKNYAGVGMFYDKELDAFIFPKCHDEAILDKLTCQWMCENLNHEPIEKP
jgi:hypothetical protein